MVKETRYDAVFDAQKHFRVLLDAMARPGSIRFLGDVPLTSPKDLHGATALVGFALLNGDVTFYAKDDGVVSYLTVNTTSQMASADVADFIFVKGDLRSPAVLAAKVGSLRYPEEGATVVVDVNTVTDEVCDRALAVTLSGPGVATQKTVYVRGIDVAILSDFVSQNAEFPMGIDMILVDRDGAITCVPRTAKVTWEPLQ